MIKNYHCGDLLSPALKDMVEKKLAKLDKYNFEEDAVIDITMSKEGKDFAMKMQLQAEGVNAVAKAVSNDMYKNIDECLNRLNSQINKR